MNQTMELQTKNLQMPLYQSQDDRIKLKISKRPKGIQYVNHIENNNVKNDNELESNKLPNIKNIFFIDKIKSVDAK